MNNQIKDQIGQRVGTNPFGTYCQIDWWQPEVTFKEAMDDYLDKLEGRIPIRMYRFKGTNLVQLISKRWPEARIEKQWRDTVVIFKYIGMEFCVRVAHPRPGQDTQMFALGINY